MLEWKLFHFAFGLFYFEWIKTKIIQFKIRFDNRHSKLIPSCNALSLLSILFDGLLAFLFSLFASSNLSGIKTRAVLHIQRFFIIFFVGKLWKLMPCLLQSVSRNLEFELLFTETVFLWTLLVWAVFLI